MRVSANEVANMVDNEKDADEPIEESETAQGGPAADGAPAADPAASDARRAYNRAQEQQAQAPTPYPEPTLQVFLSGLYAQALGALGATGETEGTEQEANLPEAQYLIDIIAMLKEKSERNRTTEEDRFLTQMLHDLRMRYVARASESSEEQPENDEDGEQ
jgi:hypothetical protein